MRLLTALVLVLLLVTACNKPDSKQLTLAVLAGVEGEALKQAALDYEKQTGIHVQIAQFPYANLFEKELIDFNAHTGAYDLVMMDDPWFPRFAGSQFLTDLTPLLQKRGQPGPDTDFVASSVAVCRHPYQTGALYALPYVVNSQLFFYRKDLFAKHGLNQPATWSDVLTAGIFVSDAITIAVDKPDGDVSLGIRPEHVHVLTEPQDNAIPARVYVTELMGNETFVFLSMGGQKLIARAAADFRAEVESTVWIQLDTKKVNFFAKRQTTDYTD